MASKITKIKPVTMVKNIHRVSARQWRKWSETARRTFNAVYRVGMDSPTVFQHPKFPQPKPAQWKTLCWNFAWIAADAAENQLPDEVVTQ